MTDHLEMARRGAHAARELCRLLGAALTADDRLKLPALAAMPGLPADMSDIGGLPQLAVEIMRAEQVYSAEGVAAAAMARGLNIAALRLGSFLCECMDSPAFQPQDAVQSVCNFAVYCEQLRAVERLTAQAWAGKRIPQLAAM
jgi:hypothetical protein